VGSVIDLSHTLGLTTVAEGVEISDIAAVLSGYGCDIAKGHYFSHPVTAPELLNLTTQPTRTTDRDLSNCLGGLRLSTHCGANGSQQH
jgi:EAL domain-containing protein (putative c-di-GMP-specific phosphodiesterase class I)